MDLRQDEILLFKRFAHLYDSGVPLAEALDLVRGELHEPLREAVAGIVDDLYRGISFADALTRRADLFAPEIVGVIRAGEARGELAAAARSAASGLAGHVLDPASASGVDLDAMLEGAGEARVLHLLPDGVLRARHPDGLRTAGQVEPGEVLAIVTALARRARIEEPGGTGAFLFGDRLVRVALAATPAGPSAVVRLSGVPGAEPAEAAAWRRDPPGLLLVLGDRHADKDAALRAVLRGFPAERTQRVAVDLPVPEAVWASSLEAALGLDPDVVCVGRLWRPGDAVRLADAVEDGVHAVAGVSTPRLFAGVPHAVVRVS